jgi:hypothetical protein
MDLVEVLNFLFQLGSLELGEVLIQSAGLYLFINTRIFMAYLELFYRDFDPNSTANVGRFT